MASASTLSPAELTRYSRHILLGEIGREGQERLAGAKVLVIGAGGLGSPAALYLAAAGVGTLGIADFDRVEVHNLQRQLLHGDSSVGAPKVDSAAARLQAMNPHVRVVTHPDGITVGNALGIFSAYDIVVDGTDNFASRYLHNDAACLAGKPLVYGSVYKFEGQVSVFHPAAGGPCYRCLFPEAPPAGAVPGCGEVGVVGALCGVIGSLQALEAIKLVVGFGETLRGRLLTYDALAQRMTSLTLAPRPRCTACGPQRTLVALDADRYAARACAAPSLMPESDYPIECSVQDAHRLATASPTTALIIDVREPFELEICRVPGARHIPRRRIPVEAEALPRDRQLLILCHAGGRSRRVTEYLRSRGFAAATNIAGGIDAWAAGIDPAMARY